MHPNVTEKVISFKDAFLKMYEDAINHPEKAIHITKDPVIDDWRENSNILATQDNSYDIFDVTDITINIAELRSGSSIYLRICDHLIAENKRQQYDQVTKSCQDQHHMIVFHHRLEH